MTEHTIQRRLFLTLLGSAAAARPMAARTQQPVVGWLQAGGSTSPNSLSAFRQGLTKLGYVEGRNLAVEFRNSEQYNRLPALASEFVRRQVAVIFAFAIPAAVAARAANRNHSHRVCCGG
jgi:hypothetical protein